MAGEDFLHHEFCTQTFDKELGEHRYEAEALLTKMGVPDTEHMAPSEICSLLGELTCKVVQTPRGSCSVDEDGDKIPEAHRITLSCGGKRQCYNVLKLKRKIETNKRFAARLSQYQINRVHRLDRLIREEATLPCHILADNARGCQNLSLIHI